MRPLPPFLSHSLPPPPPSQSAISKCAASVVTHPLSLGRLSPGLTCILLYNLFNSVPFSAKFCPNVVCVHFALLPPVAKENGRGMVFCGTDSSVIVAHS